MSRLGHYRPMPKDFPEHALMSMNKLMKQYHAGAEAIIRWRAYCGVYRPPIMAVISTDKNGNEKRYSSVNEAAAALYASKSHIYKAVRTGSQAYGYWWRKET